MIACYTTPVVLTYIQSVVLYETRIAMAMNREFCAIGRHFF
jgi:hypothetical protein